MRPELPRALVGFFSATENAPIRGRVRENRVGLTMEITDERNSLERVLLHFAHFEKQCERLSDNRYRLHLKYYENDETELVIRILSFGPYVQVTEPAHVVDHVKKRLLAQKNCGLR